jgi:hypothetical protein
MYLGRCVPALLEESDASTLGFLIYLENEGGNFLQNIGTYLHGFAAQNRADIMSVADIDTAVGRNFVLANIAVSPPP